MTFPSCTQACVFPEGRARVSSSSPQIGGPPRCLLVQPIPNTVGCDSPQTHATSSKTTLQHTHMAVKSRGSPVGVQRRHSKGSASLAQRLAPTCCHHCRLHGAPGRWDQEAGELTSCCSFPALGLASPSVSKRDLWLSSLCIPSPPLALRCPTQPRHSPQPARTSHQKALLVLGDLETKRQVRYAASTKSQLKLVMVAKWEVVTETLHRTCGSGCGFFGAGHPLEFLLHSGPSPSGCPRGAVVV